MPRDDRSTDDRRLRSSADERRRSSDERRMFRGSPRLDIPREWRRTFVPRPVYDADAFGRLSERIARFLGTGRFLVYMTATIVFWVVWNIFAPASWRFDEYPFQFLTLALSLQASYAAPLILLAQNRQADRDRVQYEQDRALSVRGVEDAGSLAREVAAIRVALGEVATRDYIRGELQRLVEELAPSADDAEDAAS